MMILCVRYTFDVISWCLIQHTKSNTGYSTYNLYLIKTHFIWTRQTEKADFWELGEKGQEQEI